MSSIEYKLYKGMYEQWDKKRKIVQCIRIFFQKMLTLAIKAIGKQCSESLKNCTFGYFLSYCAMDNTWCFQGGNILSWNIRIEHEHIDQHYMYIHTGLAARLFTSHFKSIVGKLGSEKRQVFLKKN